jgi:hypothetical protein
MEKKSNYFIRYRIQDLHAYNIVLQPLYNSLIAFIYIKAIKEFATE